MWFKALSRLKINLEKSELIIVGRVSNVDSLADELGCKVGSLPTTYLSLPLGAHCKSVAVWDGVKEHFKKRFTSWKRQYISKGGMITLIKSMLSTYLVVCYCLCKECLGGGCVEDGNGRGLLESYFF